MISDPEIDQRLRDEIVIWLTTVNADGTPTPSPVWFHWDGESFVLYSYEKVPRVRNIAERPHVSLHLNCTSSGADVVVLTGRATIDPSLPRAHEHPGYAAKYRDGIAQKGGPEFSRLYPVPIRITPRTLRRSGVRGWTFVDLTGARPPRTRAKGTPPIDRLSIS